MREIIEVTPYDIRERVKVLAETGNVTRPGEALLADDAFTEPANFAGVTFTDGADFAGATFTNWADFRGATFTEPANFAGVTFTDGANFEGATFTQRADFAGATFNERADFAGATFTKAADFEGATFTKAANFPGATFNEEANFINAEMKSKTIFSEAEFRSEPPRFFGAKLREGTTWYAVTWPLPPKDAPSAERFVAAYEHLKLEMDRLKRHEDELDFFAREMQCRRVLQGSWRGLPITIYGALCDYGRSYIRPLLILLVTAVVGAIPFWGHSTKVTLTDFVDLGHALKTIHLGLEVGFANAREAIGLSFANTFGVLGTRKDLIASATLQNLPGWLKVIASVQTGLGIVLLFLFSLGLRNRFRMK